MDQGVGQDAREHLADVYWAFGAFVEPVASAAYCLKGAAPVLALKDIYIGLLQFNVIQKIAVVLVLLFPALALWLPNLLFGMR